MPDDDPILKRLASEVGSRTFEGLKTTASTTKSLAGALARNAPSKAAATAAAVGAAATAGVSGGRSVAVKGFDFLRPQANVPFYFVLVVVAVQAFDLFTKYVTEPTTRLFAYFLISLVALAIIKNWRQVMFLAVLSFLLPYGWQFVPKDNPWFVPVNSVLFIASPVWGWWAAFNYKPGSFLGEAARIALIVLLGLGTVWPVMETTAKTAGLDQYVPKVDPGQGFKALEEGWKVSMKRAAQIPESISKGFRQQIKLAAGDFYTGEVDKNVKEPLGVSIEKLEPADPAYFEGEKVTVWTTLKARTLDEPITIIPKCWSDKGRRDELQGFILPPQIEVDSYESDIFNCRFELLKAGSRRIKTAATFNFNTKAYQKTYFMDKDKIRSLRREQIDPLDFYKITDKKPVAVFTNGPVMIGMSVPEPPVGLKQGDFTQPFIGVTLSNNWQGRIESLTELRIELPKGFEIDAENPDSCSHAFKFVETGDDGYNVYGLDIDKERVSDPEAFTDIEKFQSFRCLLKVKDDQINEILGGTPISVKYEKPIRGSDAVATIKYWADKYGVPKKLALQVALAEGRLQHYGSDGKTVKRGDGGCSFGVMQINTCAHKQCIGKVRYDPNSGDMCRGALSCAGTDVNDINCNIEAGIRHLKNGYIHWQTVNSQDCSCGEYSGWDYALKYYNGCSCGNDYVKLVKGQDVDQYLV
ncbi:hypothetical protein HYV82_01130 [Candidatus Woesearchaeota archaeon]|nr:hypothetical protein [Candidatus Woesearchaeota archaeon]